MAAPAIDTVGWRDRPSSTSEQPTADADSREMMNAERHIAATIRIGLADDEQAQQEEGR